MCVLVCVFMMVHYGDNLEVTAMVVCTWLGVLLLLQYGDYLEATTLVCVVYLCMSL